MESTARLKALKRLKVSFSNSPKNPVEEEGVKKQAVAFVLGEIIEAIEKKYFPPGGEQKSLPDGVFDLLFLVRNLDKISSYDAYKSVVLNKAVDFLSYKEEVTKNLEAHWDEIAKTIGGYLEGSIPDFAKIECTVSFGQSDPHSGKTVAIVEFMEGDKSLFKVVYKPRDAQVDAQIIELFSQINGLAPQEKSDFGTQESFRKDLPVFSILSFEDMSVWEFIEGESPGKDNSAQQYIVSRGGRHKQKLAHQAVRLEAICNAIHLTDLHGENVIFMGLDGDNSSIVPIDLENVQEYPHQRAGLLEENAYGSTHLLMPQIPSLTQAEMELIERFLDRIPELPVRIIALTNKEVERISRED